MSFFEIQMRGKRTKRFFCVTILYTLISLGCSNEGPSNNPGKAPLTIEEAKQLKYRITLENVYFDIPVLYNYTVYSISGGWPRPSQGEIDGTSRRKVDSFMVEVLLPDMAVYDKSNATEFDVLGHGNRLRIKVNKLREDWPHYFNNAFKRLIPLDKSALVPNMLRFRDSRSTNSDVYFSSIDPKKAITMMSCYDPENSVSHKDMTSQNCSVVTVYQDKIEVTYTFSLDYLPRWKETDEKTRALLDSFIDSASTPPGKL